MNHKIFPINIEMAISEVIIAEKYAIFLRNDDILQVQIAEGVECDVEDMKMIIDAIAQVSNGKKHPLMALYGSLNTFTTEGMEIIAKHPYSLADALVTREYWAMELIAKFYLKRFNPIRPTKIFSNEEAALDWLKSFIS